MKLYLTLVFATAAGDTHVSAMFVKSSVEVICELATRGIVKMTPSTMDMSGRLKYPKFI